MGNKIILEDDIKIKREVFEKMNIHQLRSEGRKVGVASPTNMNHSDLVEKIYLIVNGFRNPDSKSKMGRPVKENISLVDEKIKNTSSELFPYMFNDHLDSKESLNVGLLQSPFLQFSYKKFKEININDLFNNLIENTGYRALFSSNENVLTIMKEIAKKLQVDDKFKVISLFLDETPENCFEFKEGITSEFYYSTFSDTTPYQLKNVAIVEKSVVESLLQNKHVVILLNSLTKLSKVFYSDNVLNKGLISVDSVFYQKAKKFFNMAGYSENSSLSIFTFLDEESSSLEKNISEFFKKVCNLKINNNLD